MTEQGSGTIRTVAWLEVFPWLRIARAFRLAISFRGLFLGALGILLTSVGWGLIGLGFGVDTPATEWLKPFAHCPWTAVTKVVPDKPDNLPRPIGVVNSQLSEDVAFSEVFGPEPLERSSANESDFVKIMTRLNRTTKTPVVADWKPHDAVRGPWTLLSRPAIEGLSHTSLPPRAIASVILCGLWAAIVWAFFGAAICRTAAVKLAADEQIGWGSALRFAARKWPSFFFAPLMPVGVVLAVGFCLLVLGWLMQWWSGFLLLGGIFWFLVLAATFVMAVLLLWVLAGWPLMWGTISAEGSDSFDALSRSYAYTFQRPLSYLFYAAVAAAVGWLGWLLVRNFAAGVIWLGYWAAGLGGSDAWIASLMGTGKPLTGAVMIHFWAGCVKLLAVGYLFSYFWTASTAIYFQLRRDVDHTETDEVFLDADLSEPSSDLPPVTQAPAVGPAEQGAAGAAADNPPQAT